MYKDGTSSLQTEGTILKDLQAFYLITQQVCNYIANNEQQVTD